MDPISHDAAFAMCKLPGIKERIPAEMKGLNKDYSTYLVNGRLLVGLKPKTVKDIEFHAMAERKHWPKLRDDVKDLIHILTSAGYANIYTGINCEYKRTQNLAEKCGFREIYRVGDEVIYRCL